MDLDKTMSMLEPEKTGGGGLFVPGKDRVMFRPPERKSLLGLDVLANVKRGGSKVDGAFKVPRENVSSVVSCVDSEENSASGIDDVGSSKINNTRSYSRRYRETVASVASQESSVTKEGQVGEPLRRNHLNERIRSEIVGASTGSSQNVRSGSPRYDRSDRMGRQNDFKDDFRSESRETRRYGTAHEKRSYGGVSQQSRYKRENKGEYVRKRSRYEDSKTPSMFQLHY